MVKGRKKRGKRRKGMEVDEKMRMENVGYH